MSEPRKNRLSIDGGQVKDDEHVSSYKPIPESETAFRTSKSSLAKSKEKLSPDGAEEKLLQKEEEAKIVTRVDMADAKYVVGDHRNGDAKIELDANKRQFSGLTKEELLKYAEDPFWVNLRWSLFVLFWAAWLGMLAGAIVIIVRAPKCAAPTPRTWFEKGPLVDLDAASYEDAEEDLPLLQSSNVRGVFIDAPSTYEVLDKPDILDQFKQFVNKAKEYGVKVIVDLTPNFVSADHPWFRLSENRTEPYTNYFIWAKGGEFDEAGKRKPPNNWVSTLNTSAWTLSERRDEFYLHQYGEGQPDLNFNNTDVVERFNSVIRAWMQAGADGIRLNKARQLLVNASLADEVADSGRGSAPATDHTHYAYWRHRYTSDQPRLDALLDRWSRLVDQAAAEPGRGETVFTINEEGGRPELFLLRRNMSGLRPAAAAPLAARADSVRDIATRLGRWPALQLKADDADEELATFALLLPATPILDLHQLERVDNETSVSESLSHVAALRDDASIAHGHYSVVSVPAGNDTEPKLLACARWKAGHTGYVAVYNPSAGELRANLTAVPSVPPALTVHHVSRAVRHYTNYTNMHAESVDNVLVPPRSTVVLSYVPNITAEQ